MIITSLRLTRDNQIPPSRPVTQPHTPSAELSDPLSSSALPQSKLTASGSKTVEEVENLTIIGSTATSDFKPRLFRIDTPALPLFFSGTGDMFAALTVPRLIEAVQHAPPEQNLKNTASWRSPDDVAAQDLPLAKAVQKVLASMQAVLGKTAEDCRVKMKEYDERIARTGGGEQGEKERHLALTNASEVVVPRHVASLIDPPDLERFKPRAVKVDHGGDIRKGSDELGVLHLGIGNEGGAVQVEVTPRTKVPEEAEETRRRGREEQTEANKDAGEAKDTQEQAAGDASKAGESVRD